MSTSALIRSAVVCAAETKWPTTSDDAYNGYLKNLVIAAAGKFDRHHDPLWRGGHINFWSRKTLPALLTGAGFYA